jgi:hypothetical protein
VSVTESEAGAWPEDVDIRFYADTSMTLPGKGTKGSGCGEWYPKEFCDNCGEPQLGQSVCQQRGCPSCWRSWSRRRAEKITRRLGGARHAAPEGLEKRAVHVVMSPPEGEIRSLTDVSRGFRDAYELAREKGVRGGVAVFHGFRVREEWREKWASETSGGENGPKLWAWVREHEKEWRSLTYWSPHYHIIGLSSEFEADDPDGQDGWVARRVRSLKPFRIGDLEGYTDMVGAAMYLLSHATFESDTSKDCVRWFGELATTKFSPDRDLADDDWRQIQEKAAEAAEVVPKEGDEFGEGCEKDECEKCGSSSFSPIWEAGAALMDKGWCKRIGGEQQRRLSTAFEWAIGDIQPPPGLKNPTSEEEARETFQALL